MAWYASGELFTSLETRWEDLPWDGLQAVKIFYTQEFLPGRPYTRTLDGKDWYYMTEEGAIEGIASVGWAGWVPAPTLVPENRVKRGTAVSDAEFARLSKVVNGVKTWP